tara:strand:+ start:2081 stop:2275 length:195 start_codon:yes stop_codon:yes gene_type:complete
LKRRLAHLQREGGYYTTEDFLMAEKLTLPSETLAEAMSRLWPHKTEHPWLIEKAEEREQEEQGL